MTGESKRAIWIVDNDIDDQDLIKDIFEELDLDYPLELFQTGDQFLTHLDSVKEPPFIIISDINLPKIDGFELRQRMLQKSAEKFHSVPFIFWSTQASDAQIIKAFDLKAHGFFKKASQLEEWKQAFIKIINYWTSNLIP